jgi:hypothetical protein
MKLAAGALVAVVMLGGPGLAGPTRDTLAPEDNSKGHLGGFNIGWATAGVMATADPDMPEADTAAVFFSGKDFLGIDGVHDRGYRSLGTFGDAVAGDAPWAAPNGGIANSSSVFVGTAESDSAQSHDAVPPSPGETPRSASGSVVMPPPSEAVSRPVDSRKALAPGASLWPRQTERPAAASPAKPRSAWVGPAAALPVSTQQPPPPRQGESSSVFINRAGADAGDPNVATNAVRQWLLEDLAARSRTVTSGQSSASQRQVEDFLVAGSPGPDPSRATSVGAGPGTDTVVVLPLVPFPALDAALGANVRIYRNAPSGTAVEGRLAMALEALRSLTGPQIISIGLAASGLAGLAVVWRRWRRREALAYRTDP